MIKRPNDLIEGGFGAALKISNCLLGLLDALRVQEAETYERYEYQPPFSLSAILPTLALRLQHRLPSGLTSPFAGSFHLADSSLNSLRVGTSGAKCLYVVKWPIVLIWNALSASSGLNADKDFSGNS